MIHISKFKPLVLISLRFAFFIVLHILLDTEINETLMFLISISLTHHPLLGIYGYYCVCFISTILDMLMVGIYNYTNPYHILNHALILIEVCVPLIF